MPTVIRHHKITKGADHWLSSAQREKLFGSIGVTNIRTFVDPQDPTRVAVMMDVPDLDALMDLLGSQEAMDAREHDGVVFDSAVMMIES